MLTASAACAFLGFRNSEWDNVFGGIIVFYLVATAWNTARREEGETGIVDVIGLLVAMAIAALAAIYGIEAVQSPTGTKGRSAASDFVVPFVVATLAAIGDARILLRPYRDPRPGAALESVRSVRREAVTPADSSCAETRQNAGRARVY